MGYSDRMFEEALQNLREENDKLRGQNRDYELFLTQLNNIITHFMKDESVKRGL